MACLIVNTMLTEDSSGLECEAVSHTEPSCVDTLLGQPNPEDEATVTFHNTANYSHNTATLLSEPQVSIKYTPSLLLTTKTACLKFQNYPFDLCIRV
jgi:hypothetical protein